MSDDPEDIEKSEVDEVLQEESEKENVVKRYMRYFIERVGDSLWSFDFRKKQFKAGEDNQLKVVSRRPFKGEGVELLPPGAMLIKDRAEIIQKILISAKQILSRDDAHLLIYANTKLLITNCIIAGGIQYHCNLSFQLVPFANVFGYIFVMVGAFSANLLYALFVQEPILIHAYSNKNEIYLRAAATQTFGFGVISFASLASAFVATNKHLVTNVAPQSSLPSGTNLWKITRKAANLRISLPLVLPVFAGLGCWMAHRQNRVMSKVIDQLSLKGHE